MTKDDPNTPNAMKSPLSRRTVLKGMGAGAALAAGGVLPGAFQGAAPLSR
ncbi:twin-arginine translocation signal domain-containing protein [Segnochrobactrum spirostomi]|uniref:Twin-arginine translocation signal domain-containing protein n=1 Tax=Segnochrobactrum spirostomi TaxID=2608987 RepID=A0A6A7YCE3_9HYPH|nr:twin-arginine translocation signal domain-containing protein [Segnochrobactrum spirostomi]MQT15638.1 twin-arginine translocation signal domain-containing protein [Segnochrobactrum spirostomi]